jgi:hypothetical protein
MLRADPTFTTSACALAVDAAIVAATTSEMYVKSRRWVPVPYSCTVRPDIAARMIRLIAMSGR